MAWRDFAQALTEAYTRQGYAVTPWEGAGADLQLVKAGRTTLVSCKRWKAAKVGVEVLRELVAQAAPDDEIFKAVAAAEAAAAARAGGVAKT
jgi:restriction system protein